MMPETLEYIPVPVEAAKHIAERYSKAVVIIFAHDADHGRLHTTTYGTTPDHKKLAAQIGEIGADSFGAMVQQATSFEDYRLTVAKKLLEALRAALELAWELPNREKELAAIQETINEAERFIGA